VTFRYAGNESTGTYPTGTEPIGTLCLVLHTHLPWVPHAGTWPVGEEWLHQAFAGSWRRVLVMLESLAAEGRRDLLSLGVTPIVAAMMDDPYCLQELHSWTARWQLRAEELNAAGRLGELAAHEHSAATSCLADLEDRWLTGGLSSVLRPLVDAGVVELLGGPATHPFQPLLTDRLASAQLATGLADPLVRLGVRPRGIWAPECGYAPGLEYLYAQHGVTHFLVDGPAVADRTSTAHRVGDTGVTVFARDRPLSALIWAAGTGYPAGGDYRDFHAFDHASGFRAASVTGLQVPGEAKKPYSPARGTAAAAQDAVRFVDRVVQRFADIQAELGRPGLAVAAFDTELFGHWWYEGPQFLEAVLRLLPLAGVRLSTLDRVRDTGLVAGQVELGPSSWGSGQDWRVWDNDEVADLVAEAAEVQKRLFSILDLPSDQQPNRTGQSASTTNGPDGLGGRDAVLDQLAHEAFLLTSSDWAFMVTRNSAAEYARGRARSHAGRFHELAELIEIGDRPGAERLAERLQRIDAPFGHLDARLI
jgi:1,4-alpha-glucan branching enzyme